MATAVYTPVAEKRAISPMEEMGKIRVHQYRLYMPGTEITGPDVGNDTTRRFFSAMAFPGVWHQLMLNSNSHPYRPCC